MPYLKILKSWIARWRPKTKDTDMHKTKNGDITPERMKPLLDQIARGEGTLRTGYDTSFGYGRFSPAGKLSEMTLKEVKEYQKVMLRNQEGRELRSTAVGRYQFIRKTLNEVQSAMKLSPDTVFNGETQDEMILYRLIHTRGLYAWIRKRISPIQFQLKLAKEFASIEDPYNPGKSYYGQHVGSKTDDIQAAMKAAKENYDQI